MIWNESRIWLKFEKSCLKEDKEPFSPKNVINLFIDYELDIWSKSLDTEFSLKDCLFGAVRITKNVDPDKYACTGYGIGYDSRLQFHYLIAA